MSMVMAWIFMVGVLVRGGEDAAAATILLERYDRRSDQVHLQKRAALRRLSGAVHDRAAIER